MNRLPDLRPLFQTWRKEMYQTSLFAIRGYPNYRSYTQLTNYIHGIYALLKYDMHPKIFKVELATISQVHT